MKEDILYKIYPFPPGAQEKIGDRRRALRSPMIVFKVKEEDGCGHLFGYAKNISRSGLFIASINPRSPGEKFTISFKIPDTDISVRCRCEIVWMRGYDPKFKGDPGYGVRFLDLPDETAQAIETWAIQKK